MKEFNSQRCTTIEQSERLIALGLKKETADMLWVGNSSGTTYYLAVGTPYFSCDIPAWSLHRLIEMINEENQTDLGTIRMCKRANPYNLYDHLIDCIEWLIKEGYFNKEYLEE